MPSGIRRNPGKSPNWCAEGSPSYCTDVEGGPGVLHGPAPPGLVPVRAISVRQPALALLCAGPPRVHQRVYVRVYPAPTTPREIQAFQAFLALPYAPWPALHPAEHDS
jgi:hypothetical protein